MTPRNPRTRRRHVLSLTLSLALGASVVVLAACSGGGDETASTIDAESTAVEAATSVTTGAPATTAADATTMPAGVDPAAPAPTDAPTTAVVEVVDPLDDLDEDGTIDETCGTADLGGGLVVETLCNTGLMPTPEVGVVPTAGSLLLLPSPSRWEDLADVDATVRVATTVDDRRIVIYVLGSDTLFDSGGAVLRSTAQPPLTAIVASIAARFPDAPIDVRGAADSVGEPDANQALSQQRASAVSDQLAALGIDPSRLTSQGLGENVAVAEETNADGSVNDIGRQVNRRVEIVVG